MNDALEYTTRLKNRQDLLAHKTHNPCSCNHQKACSLFLGYDISMQTMRPQRTRTFDRSILPNRLRSSINHSSNEPAFGQTIRKRPSGCRVTLPVFSVARGMKIRSLWRLKESVNSRIFMTSSGRTARNLLRPRDVSN